MGIHFIIEYKISNCSIRDATFQVKDFSLSPSVVTWNLGSWFHLCCILSYFLFDFSLHFTFTICVVSWENPSEVAGLVL
jgi:hypothetical protein